MLEKQNTTKGESISKIIESSWRKGDRDDINPPIDCDFSSI